MSRNYTTDPHASISYIKAESPLSYWPLNCISVDSNTQVPSLYGWVALSGIVIAVVVVATSFATHFLRLRHVPGPWWAAYSRSWLVRVLASGDAAAKLEEVNGKYGRHFDSTNPHKRHICCPITIALGPHVLLPRSLEAAGPLARVGPNHLLIDDPFTARRILEARFQYLRNPGFESFKADPQRTNVVAERDVSEHDRLRRQLAAGVSPSS